MTPRISPLLALLSACVWLVWLGGCLPLNEVECRAECQDLWLDGSDVRDTADLVSERVPSPSASDLDKHVVIAAHGFTASTFEWREFQQHAETGGDILVSRVLLGGHGTDVEDFRSSTWREWGRPILEEYEALVALGYLKISFICSSTGCPLILNHMRGGGLDTVPPAHVTLIDPIVLPGDKMLSMIKLFGPIVGNSPSSGTDAEKPHWYTNRPAEALAQLYELVNRIKNFLESGFRAPAETRVMVYKALEDGAADPVGALLLWKGLRHSDGSRIGVEMVQSRRHVFTRLEGRANPSAEDYALQERVFDEIVERLRE